MLGAVELFTCKQLVIMSMGIWTSAACVRVLLAPQDDSECSGSIIATAWAVKVGP